MTVHYDILYILIQSASSARNEKLSSLSLPPPPPPIQLSPPALPVSALGLTACYFRKSSIKVFESELSSLSLSLSLSPPPPPPPQLSPPALPVSALGLTEAPQMLVFSHCFHPAVKKSCLMNSYKNSLSNDTRLTNFLAEKLAVVCSLTPVFHKRKHLGQN